MANFITGDQDKEYSSAYRLFFNLLHSQMATMLLKGRGQCMLGEFRRTVATERALQMLLVIFLLGLMPQAARLIANFQHLGFAIAVFVLNLVVVIAHPQF